MPDKKRILFVDDEPRVLDGIRRMLRPMHHEWEMLFAGGGQQALDTMVKEPFDVIVSDMRMPGMDGSELLKQVKERYPETARIALSGQTKKEDILRAVGPVHQFLSKPCDADTLKSTLIRALALRNLLAHDKLRGILSQMDSLPSIPALYNELVEELESPDASIKVVEEIISRDIGMSVKVLQLVNSAFFGVRYHISSPGQAVALLGLDTVKALVLSINVFAESGAITLKNFSLDRLWRHSMSVGGIAKRIAKAEGVDSKMVDHTFIGGLLHDVGKLVFAAKLPKEYAPVLALAAQNGTTIHEAEREVFGATHAELGAYLLGLWGFTDGIVEALAFHHDLGHSPLNEFSILTVVHVANALIYETSPNDSAGTVSEVDEAYLSQLGLAERLPLWREICQKAAQEEKGG